MQQSIVVMECEYFPSITWYETYRCHETALIEQYEHFVRASYRNRAIIAGPNGVISLSVPLQGGRNQKIIMKDLKVCDKEDWQLLHWKTIETCYRNSPYFEYFEDDILPFFKTKFEYLMDANLASLSVLNKILRVKRDIKLTDVYQKDYTHDFRMAFSPKERELLGSKKYIQPFSDRNGFMPNLSMMDYVFCCGKLT
jgi:hypothetical protein